MRIWRCCMGMFLVATASCLLTIASVSASVRITIETSLGSMQAELDTAATPVTACNFLRYAHAGHYDGGQFFRTVRSDVLVNYNTPIDIIQAETREGEEFDAFGPIALERTSHTGLSHRSGALSMARWGPDTATSSFFIVVKDSPLLDFGNARHQKSDGQGFAVFGYVTQGMEYARQIYLSPAESERLQSPVGIQKVTIFNEDMQNAHLACGNDFSTPRQKMEN